MFNHLAVAMLLALIAFVLARQVGLSRRWATAVGLLPIAPCLLLPAPMYWLCYSFIVTQAAVLPMAAVVLLEVLRDSPPWHGRPARAWHGRLGRASGGHLARRGGGLAKALA